MRSASSCRARKMSVPSSNIAVTCDRPNLEIERTSVSAGRPATACSMGSVICCSISSAPKAGADALICTSTGVVSGKASISSRRAELNPIAATSSEMSATTQRCSMEMVMMRSSNQSPSENSAACGLAPMRLSETAHSCLIPPASQQPAPMESLSNCVFRRKPPPVTISSPSRRPSSTT